MDSILEMTINEIIFAENSSVSEEYSIVRSVFKSEEFVEYSVVSKKETTAEIQIRGERKVNRKSTILI